MTLVEWDRSFFGGNQMVGADVYYLMEGTVIGARYQIGKVIGEGGFGITYIGYDTRLNIPVAIKEYYPKGYAQRSVSVSPQVAVTVGERGAIYEKGKERFLNEARVIAKFIGEPGIVNVTDYFEENNTAYIVMEYLNGITLKDYIEQYGSIPADTIFHLMSPVIRSLSLIHKQGLIHRDISPDNIMLMPDGSLKLLDFGAAKDYSMAGKESMTIVLKLGYAPEEQYRSKGIQGPWTDVYALCATIYKCITGITPDESIQRMRRDDVKWPSSLGLLISQRQEQALMKGMEVEAQKRFQTVEQFVGFLNGVQETARPENDCECEAVPDKAGVDRNQGQIDAIQTLKHNHARGVRKSRPFTLAGIILMAVVLGILCKRWVTRDEGGLMEYPTERIMASDAAYILKQAGITEPVMNLKVLETDENKKYQFYTAACVVTAGRGDNSVDYNVRLIYEQNGENWRLSSQSKLE